MEFNGVKIKEMKELPKIVAQTEVGKTVEVKVWRNKKEITKKIVLGRLETSEEFNTKKATKNKTKIIESLKIAEDIKTRKLPQNTTGLVITKIANDSPVNYLSENNIIVEAQKKKIRSIKDLEVIINETIKSKQKNILIAIYNNQNQRRYIGVKIN